MEIEWEELEVLEELDRGAGAAVFKARYKGEVVAVKRFHGQVRDPHTFSKHGLSCNTMALIATNCDAVRSLSTKWP